MNNRPKTIELTVSLTAFRDRAYEICFKIEQSLASSGPELHIAETLLALHLVRRRLERAYTQAAGLTPESREELLQQVEGQRVSYDAFLAAEDLKAKGKLDA